MDLVESLTKATNGNQIKWTRKTEGRTPYWDTVFNGVVVRVYNTQVVVQEQNFDKHRVDYKSGASELFSAIHKWKQRADAAKRRSMEQTIADSLNIRYVNGEFK